ncbi:MAG: PilT protein domain protein [Parcubacteria group bacterium Greene0714_21]|nr:MAG: PilT protein domain protein [Parcubacteria group bacterium Greene0416_39]TSC97934.1 MAG: PilT protein domain protein [Parcubacteria group bacterium Greene1014_47]TSD04549.1 MAG: PilT protein domain protein [Parcubacteria group bacterium Greene0714_21]
MTIDANIAIAFLGGDTLVVSELSKWREEGLPLFLSTVAETEILSFSHWTSQERIATEQFLEQNFTSIPFDRNLSRIAASIRRDVKIRFPDAAIAATALFTHTPLVTRNQRDFKRIPNLRIVSM